MSTDSSSPTQNLRQRAEDKLAEPGSAEVQPSDLSPYMMERDMLDDPDDLSILKGVIGLAHAFHREVIAEGVETVAHGTLLLQLGCELAQGYGIARPMPASDLPAWVQSWRPDPAWASSGSSDHSDTG